MIEAKWQQWIFLGALSLVALCLYRPFLKRYPLKKEPVARVAGGFVLLGFIVYFSTSIALGGMISQWIQDFFPLFSKKLSGGWLQLITLWAIALSLAIFALFLPKNCIVSLFGSQECRPLRALVQGSFTWLAAFPCVAFAGLSASILSVSFFGMHSVEQNAVRFLQSTKSQPLLFALTSLSIVTLVPVMEEFLFRGLFHNWLHTLCGPSAAIMLSSLFFALFHFAFDQGWGNFEIVASLFVFALFLGRIYEGTRCLFSSIALHAVYNGMTILFLLLDI